MAKLPLLMGFFLSVSVSGIVFLLSLVAKVSLGTLIFRVLVVFFLFGIFGAFLGFLLEIILMPVASAQEGDRIKKEIELENKTIEEDLGDLLPKERSLFPTDGEVARRRQDGAVRADHSVPETSTNSPQDFKPVVLPRLTVENGKVVSRGDSAVVS